MAGAGDDCGGGLEAAGTVSFGAAGDEAGAVFRWKKPRMLFCCFADCDAEDADFWSLGTRGVEISLPSIPRAILRLSKLIWPDNDGWPESDSGLRFPTRGRRVSIWHVPKPKVAGVTYR